MTLEEILRGLSPAEREAAERLGPKFLQEIVAQRMKRRRLKERAALEKRRKTTLDRYGVESLWAAQGLRVRMVVSDWSVDEFGNRTRTVKAE